MSSIPPVLAAPLLVPAELQELEDLIDGHIETTSVQELNTRVGRLIRNCLAKGILNRESTLGRTGASLGVVAAHMNDTDLLTRLIADYHINPHLQRIDGQNIDLTQEAMRKAVEESDTGLLEFFSRRSPETYVERLTDMIDDCLQGFPDVRDAVLRSRGDLTLAAHGEAVRLVRKIHPEIHEKIALIMNAILPEGSKRQVSLFTFQQALRNPIMLDYIIERRVMPDEAMHCLLGFDMVGFSVPFIRNVIERLLDAGIPVDQKDRKGRSVLSLAFGPSRVTDVVLILLERGARRDAIDQEGRSLLHLLFEVEWSDDYMPILQLLLGRSPNGPDDRVDVNKVDLGGSTAYTRACYRQAPLEVLNMLRDAGADETLGMDGTSSLHLLLSNSHFLREPAANAALVEVVRNKITDDNINLKDVKGKRPIQLACQNDYPGEVTQALIDRGAKLNVRDGDLNTPLHMVARKERYTPETRGCALANAQALLNAREALADSSKKKKSEE